MRKGEIDAFLASYLEKLFRYCYVKLDFDRRMAEEAVNETCLEIIKKKKTLKKGHLDAYMLRVADNVIKRLTSDKESRRLHEVSLESYMANGENLVVKDSYFEDVVEGKDIVEAIYRKLPDDCREIFLLRFRDGLKLEEISKRTGMPYSTVRLRIEKIKKCIEKQFTKETKGGALL